MEELPKVSNLPEVRKKPELAPEVELEDGNRSIKAVREDWCSKKNRQARYRRSLSPTSALIGPKQYLFSGLRLL